MGSVTILRYNFYCLILTALLCSGALRVSAQHLPVHVDNGGIYDLLDELAGIGVIDINTTVKPYSRKEIAEFLQEVAANGELSERINREVAFYLRDFGKEFSHQKPANKRFDLFYYSDSVFRLTVNPILGFEATSTTGNTPFHRWNGGEFHGTVGESFGFYGSLRDNYESQMMGGRPYLIQRRGAVYKGDDIEQEYSEARGGFSWSWKWGQIGLHKNHYVWGSGYNGTNIFSGNTPSHAYLMWNIKPVDWFEVQYMHGWLVSEVVDSARSFQYYDGTRQVFADKYLAAALLTVKPMPALYVSFGNSIIYADTELNPAYFIPFLFYKSVDHTYNGASNRVGQNVQMFFDVSSRQISNLHLFSTIFIDEISINRMFDSGQHSNFVSMKAGARLTGIPDNFVFTAEYTRNNPLVYQHIIPSTTWESNAYNMGHYLNDNSEEVFLSTMYKPIRGVKLELSYTYARKGKDYQTIISNGEESAHTEINQEEPRWGLPFMSELRWEMEKAAFKGSWQIINDGYVYLSVSYQDVRGPDKKRYTLPLFEEGGFVSQFGINYGF